MPQHAAPAVVRIAHAPELRSRDPRNPVVPGEALVQERVVRREEFEQASVLTHQVLEQQLRLADHVLAQLSREVRIQVRFRLVVLRVLQPQPLRGESRRERLRAWVREHARNLRFQDGGLREAALGGEVEQFVVRDRGPEEEREPRREVEVRDGIALTGGRFGGRLFEAEDERRAGEDRLQRGPDPHLEPVLRRRFIVERHRPGEIVLRHRPPVRLASEPLDDLSGAGPRFSRSLRRRQLRPTGEQFAAARRLGQSRAPPRTRDHQLAQVRERRDPVVRPGLRVLTPDERPARCLQTVFVRSLDRAHERRRDLPLARPHEDRLGPDREGRAAAVLEAEQRDALAVDRDVHVLEAGSLAEECLDREHVLPVHREVVRHHHPAARPVRRALDVVPRVLRDVDRVRVLGGLREGVRVADGDPAHLRGSPQVRFEQRRREALRVGHVVERAQVGIRRQPPAGVYLEVEEVVDHTLVLGPVQALEAACAGVRVPGRRAVDHGLKRLDQRQERVGRRSALTRRRHHPGPQLPDHLFRRRRPLVRRVHVEILQDEVPPQQALVVAARAVPLHHIVQVGGRRGCHCGGRSCRADGDLMEVRLHLRRVRRGVGRTAPERPARNGQPEPQYPAHTQ